MRKPLIIVMDHFHKDKVIPLGIVIIRFQHRANIMTYREALNLLAQGKRVGVNEHCYMPLAAFKGYTDKQLDAFHENTVNHPGLNNNKWYEISEENYLKSKHGSADNS
jgi:hypothetical protein